MRKDESGNTFLGEARDGEDQVVSSETSRSHHWKCGLSPREADPSAVTFQE